MKNKLSLSLLVFTLLFSLAACGTKKAEIKLDALGENEALITDANPCSTEDEIRSAQISLSKEPFDTQENKEKGLKSVTYLLQDKKSSLTLEGHEVKNCFFQFINGKLSNITINLDDSDIYDATYSEMTKLYGEAVKEEPTDGVVMYIWEFQNDYPVKAALIGHTEDGKIVSGNFQVSYIWFDTEN